LLGVAVAAAMAWLLLLLAGPAIDAPAAAGRAPAGRFAGGLRACVVAAAYPALAWSILLLVEPGASFSAKQGGSIDYALRVFLMLSGAAVFGFGAHLLAFSHAAHDVARRARAVALAGAAASWPITVGLHGSPFGAPLGEPHLSFAVILSGLVAGVGCGYLALILLLDTALAWSKARRAARAGTQKYAVVPEAQPRRTGSR
jgi:hypothetical protein